MDDVVIAVIALLIPIIAIVGGVFVKPWLELKRRPRGLTAGPTAVKAAQ